MGCSLLSDAVRATYPAQKGTFVSPQWDPVALEMIADFRRVMGRGGALAARDGIKQKILSASDFYTAFDLDNFSSRNFAII
jgi:hypothetical protein